MQDIRKRDAGMTLVEILISVSIVSVVLLATVSFLFSTQRTSASHIRKSQMEVERKQFANAFLKISETASISNDYLHLPVKLYCDSPAVTDQACLRQLTGAGFVDVPSTASLGITTANGNSVTTPPFMEFFNDKDVLLTPSVAFNQSTDPNQSSRMQAGEPLNIPPATQAAQVYATWKLTTDASPPFLLLRTYPTTNVYRFDWTSCTNPADTPPTYTPPTTGGGCQMVTAPHQDTRTSRFIASDPTAAAQDISANLNRLFLLYNSRNPAQYMIQVATAIAQTATANLFNLTLDTAIGSRFTTANPPRPKFYADTTFPTTAVGWDGMKWGSTGSPNATAYNFQNNGTSVFFPFPTTVNSLSDVNGTTGSAYDATPFKNFFSGYGGSAAVDIKRVASYFLSKNSPSYAPADRTPELLATPIIATLFYLRPGRVPDGCPVPSPSPTFVPPIGCPKSTVYELVRQDFLNAVPESPPVVIVNQINEGGGVYFVRQLGSRIVSAVLF